MSKKIFTEEDFDTMLWHDSLIHALAFDKDTFELFFDIDYVVKWSPSKLDNEKIELCTACATLVFVNSYDITIDVSSYLMGLQIDSISRKYYGQPRNVAITDRDSEWLWTILCQEGELSFKAAGFILTLRSPPINTRQQHYTVSRRGGYSFSTRPYSDV